MLRTGTILLIIAAAMGPAANGSRGNFRSFRKTRTGGTLAAGAAAGLPFVFAPAVGTGMGTECSGAAIAGTQSEPVTVTRSSTGTCVKADGTVVTLTTNTPRTQFDGSTLGLLSELSITTLVRKTEEFDFGGIWSKTGITYAAPTVTANNATAPDGTLTADTVTFPDTSSGSGVSLVAANPFSGNPATYSQALWFKLASGTGTIYLWALHNGLQNLGKVTCSMSTTWTKCATEGLVMLGGGGKWMEFGYDTRSSFTGGSVALDVQVWGAKMELGSRITSYVQSVGTDVTRSADAATLSNPLAVTDTTWCVKASGNPIGTNWTTGALTRGLMHLGSVYAAADTAALYVDGTGHPVVEVYDATGTIKKFAATAALSTGTHAIEACNAAGSLTLSVDGSNAAGATTGAGTGTLSTRPATVYLASLGAAANLNGTLSKACIDNQSPSRCP